MLAGRCWVVVDDFVLALVARETLGTRACPLLDILEVYTGATVQAEVLCPRPPTGPRIVRRFRRMCRFWLLGARMFGRYSNVRRVGNLGVFIFGSALVLSSITGNHRMNDELGSFFEMYLGVFRHIPIDGALVFEPRDLRRWLSLYFADQTHSFALLPRHI